MTAKHHETNKSKDKKALKDHLKGFVAKSF